MRHIGNLTFLIFFIVQLSSQTLVETKIQLLEKIIHDTTRQEIVRAKAISEIDEIYWASQPRKAGKYFPKIKIFREQTKNPRHFCIGDHFYLFWLFRQPLCFYYSSVESSSTPGNTSPG